MLNNKLYCTDNAHPMTAAVAADAGLAHLCVCVYMYIYIYIYIYYLLIYEFVYYLCV